VPLNELCEKQVWHIVGLCKTIKMHCMSPPSLQSCSSQDVNCSGVAICQPASQSVDNKPSERKKTKMPGTVQWKTFILHRFKPFIMLSDWLNHSCNFSPIFFVGKTTCIFQHADIPQPTCHSVSLWSNLCPSLPSFLSLFLFLESHEM